MFFLLWLFIVVVITEDKYQGPSFKFGVSFELFLGRDLLAVALFVCYKYHVNFCGVSLSISVALSVPKHEVCLRAVMICVPTREKKWCECLSWLWTSVICHIVTLWLRFRSALFSCHSQDLLVVYLDTLSVWFTGYVTDNFSAVNKLFKSSSWYD